MYICVDVGHDFTVKTDLYLMDGHMILPSKGSYVLKFNMHFNFKLFIDVL